MTPAADPAPDADPTAAAVAALQELRARAERRRHLVTQAAEQQSPADLQRLVQELQVHQIELEMQQEELLLAQAEAERARAEYADLYEFAPVGYASLTASGVLQQLNLRAGQLLGAVRQRLVGRRFASFVAPASRFDFGQFLARVMATDHALGCELRLQRADGSAFWAQLEGLRVAADPADPAGSPARCRLALLDIGARRRAADALAASEARFRTLFADSHDAQVLLHVPSGRYVDGNAAALLLVAARRRDDVVGRPPTDLAPDHQPNGQPTAEVLAAMEADAWRLGSRRGDVCMRRATGEEFWAEAVLTALDDADGSPLLHVVWRDVTADRNAAAALRASEARLSLALEASETGIFSWDIARNELVWDARSQAIYGYPYDPAPVPVEALSARLHPDDAPRVWALTDAAMTSQLPLAVDYRVVWPDGTVRHVSSAGRAVTDVRGQSVGFAGVLRDVTALYADQDALDYKSLVLERLLQHMPMTLARFGPDGRYLEAAGQGYRTMGVDPAALVGRSVVEVFPALDAHPLPDAATPAANFLAEWEVAGQPVAFRNYGFFDEQRQQAVVLAVDVTETERQKRQLRQEKEFSQSLLENSVDGVIALDRAGCITAWNPEVARYAGVPAAQALGRPLFELLPSLGEELRRDVARALAGEMVVRQSEPFRYRAGHYDAFLVPLPAAAADGAGPAGVLFIVRDVTERDRLAEEATQLRLRAQQAVLAAILDTQETERKRIAESLHNGLGQVLYATQLSLAGAADAPPAALRPALRLLKEAIRTARTLSFELTPGILEDFGLPTALEALRKRIVPAGLPVHLHLRHLDERLPLPVELSVYRVVQELLNNVMKHAQATNVEVHVAREPGRLAVSVEDNGRGFAPAALAAQPLAGIGLAGVRNRVALLGGELSVRSQLGRGTIVSFELRV